MLKISSCPLNKWSKDIKTEDLENLKMLLKELEGATTISGSQNNQLTQLWNIATGGNKRVSRCNTCVRQTINELKNFIKDE